MLTSEPELADMAQRLGVELSTKLHQGKQSRVFLGEAEGQRLVVKCTDAAMADRSVLERRLEMVERLATITDSVVPPHRLGGKLVHESEGWLVTATPFIEGRHPDIDEAADARRLGATVAELHTAFAKLGACDLPLVATFVGVEPSDDWRLQHGDLSSRNVLIGETGLRVVDFDDCGVGPPLYDVANSLYMVMFDAAVNGDLDSYERFRVAFLAEFSSATSEAVDLGVIDALIEARIGALRRWLDDLGTAPIGIRTASPEWLDTLRAFVSTPDGDRSG